MKKVHLVLHFLIPNYKYKHNQNDHMDTNLSSLLINIPIPMMNKWFLIHPENEIISDILSGTPSNAEVNSNT